jgi:hypothetical protein
MRSSPRFWKCSASSEARPQAGRPDRAVGGAVPRRSRCLGFRRRRAASWPGQRHLPEPQPAAARPEPGHRARPRPVPRGDQSQRFHTASRAGIITPARRTADLSKTASARGTQHRRRTPPTSPRRHRRSPHEADAPYDTSATRKPDAARQASSPRQAGHSRRQAKASPCRQVWSGHRRAGNRRRRQARLSPRTRSPTAAHATHPSTPPGSRTSTPPGSRTSTQPSTWASTRFDTRGN